MKAKHLVTSAALVAIPVLLSIGGSAPVWAQDKPQIEKKSSGSISLQIDPNSPNFDVKEVEANIRRSMNAVGLTEAQERQLDAALKDLRQKAQPGKEKFTWRWEYNSDGTAGGAKETEKQQPKQAERPRNNRNRGGLFGNQDMELQQMLERMLGEDNNGGGMDDIGKEMQEMMRELFQNQRQWQQQQPQQQQPRQQGGQNMQEMMRDLLKQHMEQGGGGNRNFRFEFGPDGKPRKGGEDDESEENQGGRMDLGRLFGMGRGADFDPDQVDRDSKYSRATLAEYRGVVKDARKSTVNILREGKSVALGVVVSADGHILTVASELKKGKLEIETMDGQIFPVEVLDRASDSSKAYDLALLKVKDAKLPAIAMAEGDLPVGTMLAAAGVDEDPISVGVVSVGSRNFDLSRKPMLGVRMSENRLEKGVLVSEVVPETPADEAGVKAGDAILSLNGEEVSNADDVINRVSARRVGEEIKLKIKPQDTDETKEVTVKLRSRKEASAYFSNGPDQTAMMGSSLTKKAADFPNAITNDLGINANQCGGPVLNIEGKMVGINVARSGRTSTYMLSNKVVKDLLADLNSGKLSLVIDPATLDQDIQSYEEELKKLQETLKSAEEKLQKAKQAKEKIK